MHACTLSIPPQGSWAGRLSGWNCRPPTCWCTPACGSRLCLSWKRRKESGDEGQCVNSTSGTVRNPLALMAKWDWIWKVCIRTAAIWPQRSAGMTLLLVTTLRKNVTRCHFGGKSLTESGLFFSFFNHIFSAWSNRERAVVTRWSHHFHTF